MGPMLKVNLKHRPLPKQTSRERAQKMQDEEMLGV